MNPVDQINMFLILYKEWDKSHLNLILETEYRWHLNDSKYFLWLKVYCEFEHAVCIMERLRRGQMDMYIFLFKEKP